MRREDAELDLSPEGGAINKDAPSLFYSSSVAEARSERDLAINESGGGSASTGQAAAAGDLKDAERTGNLVESRRPPARNDDADTDERRCHPQQFIRSGDGGDLYEPKDVDLAASLPAFFPVDAASFAVGGTLAPRDDFDRQDMVLDDALSEFR